MHYAHANQKRGLLSQFVGGEWGHKVQNSAHNALLANLKSNL